MDTLLKVCPETEAATVREPVLAAIPEPATVREPVLAIESLDASFPSRLDENP